jgi:transcriptional regulator with XRE-family HTH domain
VNILKDKMVSASVFPILRQMKDSRQFEAAVLMRDANLYITSFARSLLIATPRDMLVNPDKSYKTKKYSPEQITFQQIQKYESGTNRISASRLVHMAHFLEMPIKWFFDGLDSENATAGAWDAEIFKQRETIELVRAYYGIIDLKKREAGMNILKSLAG